MNNDQACALIEKEIKPLWPGWKVNEAQLKVWVSELRAFDYASAKRATHQHYVSRGGVYPRPQLPGIIEGAKANQPKPKVEKTELGAYEADVFVHCIEHESKPGYVCWFNAVRVVRQYQDNPDYVMRAAEDMRSRCQACYGGRWIIIQQTGYRQMQQRFKKCRCGGSKKKFAPEGIRRQRLRPKASS